ncbi:MAG TPA: VirB8/TrbF family protein [Candidatus Omnitrophota bacterium]|nr:VirB8/TrbF family protein [Candidatus Omnitrophota bacterium]
MKTRLHEKLERVGRKYFEIFGDLQSENHFLRIILLGFCVLLLLTLAGAFVLTSRPPVVIRVTEVGKAESVGRLEMNNAPIESEVLYFAKNFVRRFSEYNAYTLPRDISEAMNLMTAQYQKTARRELIESGVLARVKEAGLNAQIEFKEESIERETADYVVVSLIGVKTLLSFKNKDFRESNLFKSEIVLRKQQRSASVPSGLLVEDYREIILNKLEGVK